MYKRTYVKSFDFEWTKFRKLQFGKESEESFTLKTSFTRKELEGRYVLDAGCGAGRYMDVAERCGAEVVGFDMISSIHLTKKNLGGGRKAHFLQADVNAPPFRDEVFDYVYSLGVLHHTPNTKKAFQSLLRLLSKGGTIAVWVYALPRCLCLDVYYRKLTTKLPKWLLYRLCFNAIPLYSLRKISVLRVLLDRVALTSNHPDWRSRILDTYDWYSPRYQHKHSNEEVVAWFEEAKLIKIDVLEFPVSVKGSKPQQI